MIYPDVTLRSWWDVKKKEEEDRKKHTVMMWLMARTKTYFQHSTFRISVVFFVLFWAACINILSTCMTCFEKRREVSFLLNAKTRRAFILYKKKSKSETEFILQTKGAWNESSELLTGSVLGQKECENEADVYVMWTGCDIRNMMCNIHDVGEREREELHSFGILVEVSTLLLISWPPVT